LFKSSRSEVCGLVEQRTQARLIDFGCFGEILKKLYNSRRNLELYVRALRTSVSFGHGVLSVDKEHVGGAEGWNGNKGGAKWCTHCINAFTANDLLLFTVARYDTTLITTHFVVVVVVVVGSAPGHTPNRHQAQAVPVDPTRVPSPQHPWLRRSST
jgi:hypothetical protein